jgi:hypothetical protein
MQEFYIAISPNKREEFGYFNEPFPKPLENYERFTMGYTGGFKFTLIHAASENVGNIIGSVLGVVVRVGTNIEYIENAKADREIIDFEDLRNRINIARTNFPGKKIFIDCGRWLSEVETYVLANNEDGFFSGLSLQNDAVRIKQSLLSRTPGYQDSLPKDKK